MAGGVIFADGTAARVIGLWRERRSLLQRALFDYAAMGEQVTGVFLCIGDAETHAFAGQHTGIADLTARLAIEWRLIENDGAAFAFFERGDFLAVMHQRGDDAFGTLGFVAEEF